MLRRGIPPLRRPLRRREGGGSPSPACTDGRVGWCSRRRRLGGGGAAGGWFGVGASFSGGGALRSSSSTCSTCRRSRPGVALVSVCLPPDLCSRRIWWGVRRSRRAGRLRSASMVKVAAAMRCGWWRRALAVVFHRQVLRRTRPPGGVCVEAGSCGDLVQRRCPRLVARWGTAVFVLDAGGAAGDCYGSVSPAYVFQFFVFVLCTLYVVLC